MNFTEKVFKVVSKIPRGQVMTYKQVARATGRPRAYRAVGNILNKNPHPIEIPCHRVVKSNSEVGGYVGGAKRKISLLRREGVEIRKVRIIHLIHLSPNSTNKRSKIKFNNLSI